MAMRFYSGEPFTQSRDAANFEDFRHCSSGDKIIFICHVILKDHPLKELWDFMDGSPS